MSHLFTPSQLQNRQEELRASILVAESMLKVLKKCIKNFSIRSKETKKMSRDLTPSQLQERQDELHTSIFLAESMLKVLKQRIENDKIEQKQIKKQLSLIEDEYLLACDRIDSKKDTRSGRKIWHILKF